MRYPGYVKITLPKDDIRGCVGIQPLFASDGVLERNFIFSCYRKTTENKKRTRRGPMTYKNFILDTKDTDKVFQQMFTIDKFADKMMDYIWEGAYHVRYNATVDEFLSRSTHDFRTPLIFQSEYIKTRCGLGKGNFFITSNKEIYDRISFSRYTLNRQYKFLVPEHILRPSTLLMGIYPASAFSSPLILSPLIDRNHYEEYIQDNNLKFNVKRLNSAMRYPIIENKIKEYYGYQRYIEDNNPQYWILNAVSKNLRPFYSILHFEKGLYY